MVTLVSAPGLLVFLVARSSFFTWATASMKPLNKRALNRIRFISDVVPFSGAIYNALRRAASAGFTSRNGATYVHDPTLLGGFPTVVTRRTLIEGLECYGVRQ